MQPGQSQAAYISLASVDTLEQEPFGLIITINVTVTKHTLACGGGTWKFA